MYQTTKQTNKQPNKQTNKQTMSMTLELVAQRVEVLEKQMAMLLADKTTDDKPKKKRISGYILYSNTTRDEVKDALTVDGEKPKNPDIMRELAKNWKALSEEEQEVWKAKAKDLKEAEE